MAGELTKALLVKPRIIDPAGQTPVALDFRYLAGKPLADVCNLTLPCDTEGLVSPDGVHMLIAYLQRLIAP